MYCNMSYDVTSQKRVSCKYVDGEGTMQQGHDGTPETLTFER